MKKYHKDETSINREKVSSNNSNFFEDSNGNIRWYIWVTLGLLVFSMAVYLISPILNTKSSIFQSDFPANSVSGYNQPVITNGVQEVNMEVSGSGYSPNSFVIKKGVPVKWNVNVKQLTGCNSELIMNQYGIDKKLKQGINEIDFTPDKDGTITFSCGMGMLKGSFIVTESGTATQEQIKAATPPKGMQCGGSGGGCGCGGM